MHTHEVVALGGIVLYGLGTLSHLLKLKFVNNIRLGHGSLAVVIAAVTVHFYAIGQSCLIGINPLLDLSGFLSLIGWLLVTSYLLASLRWRLWAAGAMVSGFCALLLLTSYYLRWRTTVPVAEASTAWLRHLHLVLVAFGITAFTLATATSVVYLLQDAALKRHRLKVFFKTAPSLTGLDQFGQRLILVGFPFFTVAMLTGLFWLTRLPQRHLRPEHGLSFLVWGIYAGLLVARWTVGLRGKRAAWITVIGFMITVAILSLYVLRSRWG